MPTDAVIDEMGEELTIGAASGITRLIGPCGSIAAAAAAAAAAAPAALA